MGREGFGFEFEAWARIVSAEQQRLFRVCRSLRSKRNPAHGPAAIPSASASVAAPTTPIRHARTTGPASALALALPAGSSGRASGLPLAWSARADVLPSLACSMRRRCVRLSSPSAQHTRLAAWQMQDELNYALPLRSFFPSSSSAAFLPRLRTTHSHLPPLLPSRPHPLHPFFHHPHSHSSSY